MKKPKFTLLSLFASASEGRVCAVVYGDKQGSLSVGSGTVMRHNDRLYIITCHHVAADFVAGHKGWINFFGRRQIAKQNFDLVYEDRARDVAVLRAHRSADAELRGLTPVSVSDLGTRADFLEARTARGGTTDYGLAGFPSVLSKKDSKEGSLVFCPLTYETVPVRPQKRPHALLLDYSSGGSVTLPKPHGMSGALVFELRATGAKEIWTPGLAVAVQHAWRETDKHLVCSSIDGIRRWFKSL